MSQLENAVYAALEEKILTGALRPGEPLTEARVSEETGASRTPVREALHHLEQDGLIRTLPNRSAVVVGITRRDLADIYEIRRRIEGLASRLSAENLTEEARARLLEIVEMQEFFVSRGADKLKELDHAFHETLYALCGSRILVSTLSRLHRQTGFFRRRSLFSEGRAAASVAEHRAIYEAIAARDGEAAERLTVTHVENAYYNLLKVLEETPNGTDAD
ncbi:MAG: GntR family transcriptional regulator [Clostridia bacterium]|nr:GntR family transcriptional regulator [Clostridia bacterium]